MPNVRTAIVWRRLDAPGHEAAELSATVDGWRIAGSAVLTHDAQPCRLDYVIVCDSEWRTSRCDVHGFIGTKAVNTTLVRDADSHWTVDGAATPALDGCIDVDLGFSPVTNLLPIRRLALERGASSRVRAAWVRFPEMGVEVLDQVYTCRSAERYIYESAGGAFRRELTVDESGLVLEYPELWIAEAVERDSSNGRDS
jgi:uncharacterized protein